MKPRETAVTLGVEDFKRVKEFYGEGLGCPIDKSFGSFASFKLGDDSSTLGLYKRKALAKDAGVSADGNGFRGFALSRIVASGAEVDQLLEQATRAGGAGPPRRAGPADLTTATVACYHARRGRRAVERDRQEPELRG